jgi:hypothetical protein
MLNLSLKTFSWHRVSSGYCVIRSKVSRRERIFANDGLQVPYFPFANADNLFAIFARLKSKSDLLAFVHNFGPPTHGGFDKNEPEAIWEKLKIEVDVRYVPKKPSLHIPDRLPSLHIPARPHECDRSGAGEDVEADLKEAAWFRQCLDNSRNPSRIRSIIEARTLNFTLLRVIPGSSPEAGLELRITPPNLLAALQFQLFQKLSGDTVGKFCPHCGEWFEVGPGSDRRFDAKFCSDRHRVLFNSAKRSRAN